MTNEEILDMNHNLNLGLLSITEKQILSAMIAARQDEREKMAGDAVAFMEWAAGAGWQTYDGPDRWICTQENKRVVTTAELYKLFKSKQ